MIKTGKLVQSIGLWVALAAALVGNPVLADTMDWVYEAVDPEKVAGEHAAALDAQDYAHIVYGRDALYYDWEDAEGWHSEVVDASVAPDGIAMVLDDAGHPHVVYVDQLTYDLKYARQSPAGWSIETIAEDAFSVSLCLDSAGWPHVGYTALYEQAYHGVMLKHLHKDDSGWHSSTAGSWSDVQLSGVVAGVADDDQPHLACTLQPNEGARPLSVFHAWYDHSGWQSAEFPVGGSGPKQFDAAGHLHMAYCDDDDVGWEGIAYIVGTRETFLTEPLLDLGYAGYVNTQLAVSRMGVPHVVIGDPYYPRGLQHWSKVGGVWRHTMVDTNYTHGFTLALDAADRPHVLYYVADREDWLAKSAWQDTRGWHTQWDPSSPIVGMIAWNRSQTLMLTHDNQPRLAYSRHNLGTVFYWRDDVGWHERVLAKPALGIGAIRLALDAQSNPHIAYNSSGGREVSYAWRNTAGWHTTPLEGTYFSGRTRQSDMALDSEGHPHIGCLSTDRGLKYMVLRDGGWESTVLDTEYVWELALALDGMGRPHFLVNEYEYAASTRRLVHLWQDDGGWHQEPVAPVSNSESARSLYPRIAMDHIGELHICYYDQQLSNKLKYGHRTAQGWQMTTVDSNGAQVGAYCSLDLDDQNQPHIAYTVWQPGQLRYARKDATGWHISTVDSAGGFYDFDAALTSLCLAPDGTPQIAYSRSLYEDEVTVDSADFCYARLGATGWEVSRLEKNYALSSLVVDPQGRPHIAYSGNRGNLSYIYGVPAPPALDHFTWSVIPSPKVVGVPFPVTLTARNPSGIPVTSFTDTVTLSGDIDGFTTTNLTVGTGTGSWDFPLFTWCHDARTQVIYPADELGGGGTLTTLALEVTTPPGQTLENWTLRMKHTSLTEYPASPQWEGGGWTVVYQGDEPAGTTGWRTFEFSTTFDYNGTDNLLIDFSFNNASFSSGAQCRSTVTATPRSLWSYSDSYEGDPLSWSGTTPYPIADWTVPNLVLGLTQGSVVPVNVTPSSSGPFVNGVWTGTVTVPEQVTNLFLRVDDGAGHTGESSLFSVLYAPHLQNCRLNAGQFAFDLSGEPGCKLLIQASTDLRHWVTLHGCQLADTPLGFVDPESHLYPKRFYRLMAAEGVAMLEQHRWESGQFHLNLVGEPGRTVVIDASTNLANWTPIATNILGSDPLIFTDPQSAQFPRRFYRLFMP